MEELEIKLKEQGKIKRLTNKTFQFDPRIGAGHYSANYFLRSRQIVAKQHPGHIVTMQWFQRRDDSMLCGVDEAIAKKLALDHKKRIGEWQAEIKNLEDPQKKDRELRDTAGVPIWFDG
ncbi:MAG: hypothetical protein J6038_00445, partial [Bacilli bacterium]|nr:hypothetical protein [Bacilli bacterium]